MNKVTVMCYIVTDKIQSVCLLCFLGILQKVAARDPMTGRLTIVIEKKVCLLINI